MTSDVQTREAPMRSGLTPTQLWVIVAIVVTQFLLLHGLVWRKLDDLDASILWSYATIPLLVAGVLGFARRLNPRTMLLATVEVVAIKFVITATFLVIVLMIGGAPPAPTEGASLSAPVPAGAPPPAPAKRAPSAIPDSLRGTAKGVVVDADGKPVAGALVWIEAGVDRWSFAPSVTPVRFENAGRGFSPRLAAVEVDQPIEVRATDGKLHTFAGQEDGRMLWNFPVLASGSIDTVRIADAHGLATLYCTVAEGDVELPSRIVVLAHPFHALSGADGSFTLAGVPAGTVTIAAASEKVGPATMSLDVVAGGTAEARIKLP